MGKIIRNGINYGGTYEDATSVNYDGTASGLEARTVQEAVDEVKETVDEVKETVDGLNDSLGDMLDTLGYVKLVSVEPTSVPAGTTNVVPVPLTKGSYLLLGRLSAVGEVAGGMTVSFDGGVGFSTYQSSFHSAKSSMGASVTAFVHVPEEGRTPNLRVYHNQSSNLSVTEARVCVIQLK